MVDDEAFKSESSFQLTLSIGKLSKLAQMQNHDVQMGKSALDGISSSHRPGKHHSDEIIAFDDGLDTVAVQEDLVQQFIAMKSSTRAKQSFESLVEIIVKAKATRLDTRPAYAYVRFLVSVSLFCLLTMVTQIFKQLLRQLLLGKALSDEELVDLLSLKDNDESLDDFYAALHILTKTKGLPESRQLHAFRSVWRRIYLHDKCVLVALRLSVGS